MTDRSAPIFKVITNDLWEASARGDVVLPMPVDIKDGFMHFSGRDQLEETLRLHFKGQRDLVLLAIDPGKLGMGLTWERSKRRRVAFPHLYAPCPKAAVLWHASLDLASDGSFILPSTLR
jgi:uncharacterized protein (DUF952 family)